MLESLNRHVIEGQEEYWTDEAKWRGPAGAGTKNSLKEFQQGWQNLSLTLSLRNKEPGIYL